MGKNQLSARKTIPTRLTWYERYFLIAEYQKLAESESFCVRKVNFPHTLNFTELVGKNQLSARKMIPSQLTWYERYFLIAEYRNLAESESFCVWKVDFLHHLKFYRTSAGKSTFRMQNDTNSDNFQYSANKKYRSYQVRKVF